ncbi:MAG: hypothetical protein J2P17_29510 [Mycobacterium sp.]|nr:hypothetical protein [Mycobacterium sp.]
MKIISNEHRYADGDVALTGFLVRPDDVPERAPALLLVHGGAGLDEHARTQAKRYDFSAAFNYRQNPLGPAHMTWSKYPADAYHINMAQLRQDT